MTTGRDFWWRLALVGLPAAILPSLLGPSLQTAWILSGTSCLTVLGLILLMGFTGQPSLGQAAFYGMGAYAVAIGTTAAGWSFPAAAGLGVAVAAASAALVGLGIFRLRGHFLALATLAFGEIVYTVMAQSHLTGGAIGISRIPPLTVLGVAVSSPRAYAYAVWGVVVLCLLAAEAITRSPAGLALRAVRDDDQAACSVGISPLRYKVAIFVASSIFAALGGALYASFIGYVSAEPFGVLVSIQLLLMAIVGGMEDLFGAVVGTLVILFLNDGLAQLASSLHGVPPAMLENVVFGLLLIALVIARPQGIVGRARGGRRRMALGAWAPFLGKRGGRPRVAAGVALGLDPEVDRPSGGHD